MSWLGPKAPGQGEGHARPLPRRQPRVGVAAATSQVLGVPVTAAVPLQRHRPALVFALSLAELAALAILVATASLAGLALLVLVSAILVAVNATNRRHILAVTSQGNVDLSASKRGHPIAATGPVPSNLALPEPGGLGRAISLGEATWWVDRSAYRFLRQARGLLQADGEDDGGEGEHDRRQDRDSVEVALDNRRARGRRPEAAAEHLRQASPSATVQEDQHDEGS